MLEVGNILEGRVTGIKPFGAFVALPEGKVGMVHISEVSNAYVQDIAAVLHEGETVKVKVIGISPEGKIALSIKAPEIPADFLKQSGAIPLTITPCIKLFHDMEIITRQCPPVRGTGGFYEYGISLPAFRPSVKRGALPRRKRRGGKRSLRRRMGGRGT